MKYIRNIIYALFILGFFIPGFVSADTSCAERTSNLGICSLNPSLSCSVTCGLSCFYCTPSTCGEGVLFEYVPTVAECVPTAVVPCDKRITQDLITADLGCGNPLQSLQDACEDHCEGASQVFNCVYTSYADGGPTCAAVVPPDSEEEAEQIEQAERCADRVDRNVCYPGTPEEFLGTCVGTCQEDVACSYSRVEGKCKIRERPIPSSNPESSGGGASPGKVEVKPFDKDAFKQALGDRYKEPPGYDGILPKCAFRGDCNSLNDLLLIGINVGKLIFQLIGAVAFVMFVIGGFFMIAAFGNAERFKKGQQVLVSAVIGMLISFSAYLLVSFILDALQVSSYFLQ